MDEQQNQDQAENHPDGTTPPDQDGADGKEDDVLPPPLEMVTIDWKNCHFEVPKYRADWDMNVQFEFEEGRRLHGLLTLVGGGPAGIPWAREALYAGGVRTNGDVDRFMAHTNEVLAKECKDAPEPDDDK